MIDFLQNSKRLSWLTICCVLALGSLAGVCAAEVKWDGTKDQWHGYDRYTFQVDGRRSYVVVPKKKLIGNPWVWRARFPDFHYEADLDLLSRGVHIAFTDVSNLYGSPKAVAHGDKFYDYLVKKYHFKSKPALEGVSRGGLFVYNWALANPDKVACMYLDTPVLDFKSWPGGKFKSEGSPSDWKRCLDSYGLTEEEAMAYKKNPVDRADEFVKSGIWVMHIVSENDQVVPPEENTYLLKKNATDKLPHYRFALMKVKKGTAKSKGHHFKHPNPKRAAAFMAKFAIYEGGSISSAVNKTLEAIDQIYAQIPPLRYVAPAGRGQHLSGTIKKLKQGGELRIVMLGDSIVNDTSRSEFQLLLERDFPKCKITKFTSVRGSTGCWFYQQPDRVQMFVLDQKPDLVIIGGISQRDDIPAIRSVIQQTKKAMPATEFLLMSGAFGREKPIADPTFRTVKNDYRTKLKALAKEMNVEFLDMRGAWLMEMRASGETVDWYKRDPVHANDKGKQVIGRILYRYLKPE